MTALLAHCPSTHYSLASSCALPPGHREIWHETFHPETGQRLRYRRAFGIRHTQEWVPDDDPGAPDSGEWVTWHYVEPQAEPTPVIAADLDDRSRSLVSGHTALGQIRPGGTGIYGIEELCSCGTWFNAGSLLSHNTHLGREVSVLARGFFDSGRREGMREAAAMLRAHCPDHSKSDQVLMDCHCAAATEIERDATEVTR